MYNAILYITVSYILRCKLVVTITRHVFINIFQKEHFSYEICHELWKIPYEFSCEISKKLKKRMLPNRADGSFKSWQNKTHRKLNISSCLSSFPPFFPSIKEITNGQIYGCLGILQILFKQKVSRINSAQYRHPFPALPGFISRADKRYTRTHQK